ncbi:kinase-like protein [Rhizophagus irregularis]|nr:kinase-like protein [Rhizophagus irregularis]
MNLCFLPNDGRKYIIIKLTIIKGLVEYFKSCLFVYHDIPTFATFAANEEGNLEYLTYIEDHLKHELPLYPIFFFDRFIYRAYYGFFGYGRCIECNLLFKDKNLWCKYCHSKRFQDNFSKWDSGDETINDIIRKTQLNAEKTCQVIEWIPYDDFENIEHFARGGFSRVYRANWIHGQILSRNYRDHDYIRNKNMLVALKELNNSSNINDNFLNELRLNIQFNNNPYTLKVLGISRNPSTKNYIIVTNYMKKGSLLNMLSRKKITNWLEKLYLIQKISEGIKLIHDAGFLHCDIHSGNIFYENVSEIYISDFGISIPAYKVTSDTKINGVLAYTAPEIVNGDGTRTIKSDIYSLGILYWEIITQKMAFASERNDELFLSFEICKGLRPKFEERTPEHLKKLIESCWDADPQKRPTIEYINFVIGSMIFYLMNTREDLAEEFRLKSQAEEENEVNDQSQYSKVQEEENEINQSKDSLLTSKLSFKEALFSTYRNSYDEYTLESQLSKYNSEEWSNNSNDSCMIDINELEKN